ncbi:MAG: amino acid permease, partial [Pseudonocardia sp.]
MSTSDEISDPLSDALSEDGLDDIELVDEKPLSWFDVSAIGTGEMLFTAGWAWIVFIASSFGILWSILGFVGGVVIIHT